MGGRALCLVFRESYPIREHGLPHGLSNFTENLTFDSNSTSDSDESDVLKMCLDVDWN